MTKALASATLSLALYMHEPWPLCEASPYLYETDVSPANIDFTTVEKNKTKISLELGSRLRMVN